jgi:hypothetical protein
MIDSSLDLDLNSTCRDVILQALRARGWLHFSGSVTTQVMHLGYGSMLEFRFPREANQTVLFFKEFRSKEPTWVLEVPTLAALLSALGEAE